MVGTREEEDQEEWWPREKEERDLIKETSPTVIDLKQVKERRMDRTWVILHSKDTRPPKSDDYRSQDLVTDMSASTNKFPTILLVYVFIYSLKRRRHNLEDTERTYR